MASASRKILRGHHPGGRAIALNSQAKTYYARGRMNEAEGKSHLAITDFRKAIELQSKAFFDC
jgi:hypothetical protein